MRTNPTECVNLIVKLLKDDGMTPIKGFEQKRKITESEVTKAAFDGLEIDKLIATIGEWETRVTIDRRPETA